MAALSDDEIAAALEALPGWRHGEGEIFKNFKFGSFQDAVAFIVRLAEKAEAANHHPDLQNSERRVRVALHTWSENAITQRDVDLAGAIESVSEPPGSAPGQA